MSHWYYAVDNEPQGPISGEELVELAETGRLGRDDLVWTEGLDSWEPARHFLNFPTEAPTHAPPERPVPPSPMQRMPTRYAGFWLRAVALVIDSVILFVLLIALMLGLFFLGLLDGTEFPVLGLFDVVVWFASMAGGWLYFALFESSKYRATPGKRALGLVVTDLEGNRISFGRATVRHFAKIISGLILYIGYLMAAFTRRKQALHDIIADCLVLLPE